VVLAHKLAMASEWVTADMVEATEFPHLANKYQVYGVPRSVINEVIHIEGAVPEGNLISQLMTVQNEAEMKKLKARWNIN
jgi:predicted DsbA family dithiol-disulfide isomerase